MALNQATLALELRKLMDPGFVSFAGHPASTALGAANFANAYDLYASSAVDKSGSAVLLKNKPGFAAAITGGTTAAQLASQFANAFLAYWTGGTFAVGPPFATSGNVGGNGIFSVELTAVVSLVNPAPLLSALQTLFATNTLDGHQRSTDLAAALHTATTSNVTVLISGLDTTPPIAGPLPIANTGLIA